MKKWSSKIVETIMSQCDEHGYHPVTSERWAYVPGMLLMAVARAGEQSGNLDYLEFMRKHMDLFVDEDGLIKGYVLEEYNLDQINQGKNLFYLMGLQEDLRYEKAAHLLAAQLRGQPRTLEGGFWHKKIYPYQMWLDGLYMSSPFLAQYAKSFKAVELFHEIAHQLLYVEMKTRDAKTGLLFHGWDEAKEQEWSNPLTGQSNNFWGRAMGWYAMAMVDSLEHFPIDHPKRGTLIGIFRRMCIALRHVQDSESGLWYQVLDQGKRKGNYLEASASCMFVYALAKGVRLHYLEQDFAAAAVAGYQGIVKHMVSEDETGVHLHHICFGAGLSADRNGTYEYYIGEKVGSDHPMGVAPWLLASLELERVNLIQ